LRNIRGLGGATAATLYCFKYAIKSRRSSAFGTPM